MNSVESSRDDDRTYSNYMIPQITESLTEFSMNVRVLNLANPQVNYADYLRIADYIGNTPELGTFDLPN